MVMKISECYEHVHGVVCSSFFFKSAYRTLSSRLDWPPYQTVASHPSDIIVQKPVICCFNLIASLAPKLSQVFH